MPRKIGTIGLVSTAGGGHTRRMQIHLPHPQANWQPWARGVAIVLGLVAGPIVLALVWLTVFRGVFF
jgi:hypothetical protein